MNSAQIPMVIISVFMVGGLNLTFSWWPVKLKMTVFGVFLFFTLASLV